MEILVEGSSGTVFLCFGLLGRMNVERSLEDVSAGFGVGKKDR